LLYINKQVPAACPPMHDAEFALSKCNSESGHEEARLKIARNASRCGSEETAGKKHKRDGRWYRGNNNKLENSPSDWASLHPSLSMSLFMLGYETCPFSSSLSAASSHDDAAHATLLFRRLIVVLVKVRNARRGIVRCRDVFL
jgi:hypothetical protein